MDNKDRIILINGINDKKEFFSSLMKFYASFDVILTVWGKLPKLISRNLFNFRTTGSKIRKYLFGEINIMLNDRSLDSILDNLCQEEILSQITWGLHKDEIPLALMRDWDDLHLDYSSLIDDDVLINMTEDLKSDKIIKSFDIITD